MIEKVKNIKNYKILIKFEKYKLRGLQFFIKNKFTKNDYRSKRPYPAGDIQIHSEPGN